MTLDYLEYFFFSLSFEIHSPSTSFILAWRVPWPGWPLAFQVFQFSGVASVLLSMSFCVTEKYRLIVKIDPHKDGCCLEHIFGIGRTRSLSRSSEGHSDSLYHIAVGSPGVCVDSDDPQS